jgi:hypothetical protein
MPHLMYRWLLRRARLRWPDRTVETGPLEEMIGTPRRLDLSHPLHRTGDVSGYQGAPHLEDERVIGEVCPPPSPRDTCERPRAVRLPAPGTRCRRVCRGRCGHRRPVGSGSRS